MTSPMFTRILLGWDGSAGAEAGLRVACQLTGIDGGVLVALAVVPGFDHIEELPARHRADEQARSPLQSAFDAAMESIVLTDGQNVSLEFIEAVDVAKALDGYADLHALDLVVVGLHGQDGLLHPRMGHVAAHAVRAGRWPVLVVPDPGRAAGAASGYTGGETPASRRQAGFFPPFTRRH